MSANPAPPNPLVKVTDVSLAGKHTITVGVNLDPIHLGGHGHGAVPIKWEIDPSSTPGWSFGQFGIGIPGHNDNFETGPIEPGGKHCTWTRRAGKVDGKTYKYQITVTDGNTTVVVDPIIINEG